MRSATSEGRAYVSVVLLSAVVTACAAVSGLGQYNEAPGDDAGDTADAYSAADDATAGPSQDSELPSTDGEKGQHDSRSEVNSAVEAATEDATTEATADAIADATTGEVSEGGSSDALGGDGPVESASTSDASADAGPPKCGPDNCGGCCDSNGQCAGGESNGTCGVHGGACTDCTSNDKSCNRGVCGSAPVDAGSCSKSACALQTLCIPVWEQACCKSDNTCGCLITIPLTPCL